MRKKMKLAKNLVLIRVDKPKEQTESGVFIQEEWISHIPIGIVEEVADNVTECKVGDRVWFERYTSIPHPENEGLRACREDAIIAVL